MFNFAQGSLWLSGGTNQLSEADRDICHRFTEVFAFAYSRFLELQEKEVRNRELEVEIALERVRARALGMQHSEELSPLASEFRRELRNLSVPIWDGGTNIVNEEEAILERWMPVHHGQVRLIEVSFEEIFQLLPHTQDVYDAWKQGERSTVHEVSPEEALAAGRWWDQKCLEVHPDLPRTEPELRDGPAWAYNLNFAQGFINLHADAPLSDADQEICHRFTDVFAFAYARFLELQEKEERNREFENALERLRAQAQGMQKSEDLSGVARAFADQLKGLEVPVWGGGINILNKEEGICEAWMPNVQDVTRLVRVTFEDWFQFWWYKDAYDAWEKGEKQAFFEVTPEEGLEFEKWWNAECLEAVPYPGLDRSLWP